MASYTVPSTAWTIVLPVPSTTGVEYTTYPHRLKFNGWTRTDVYATEADARYACELAHASYAEVHEVELRKAPYPLWPQPEAPQWPTYTEHLMGRDLLKVRCPQVRLLGELGVSINERRFERFMQWWTGMILTVFPWLGTREREEH